MLTQVSRTTKLVLIAEFILLAYMMYVLSTSLYKSYQIDKFIQMSVDENAKLLASNEMLEDDYEYYSSNAYKEKIAKQNLGLVRQGEEVIILAPEESTPFTVTDRENEISEQYFRSLSNPQKWYLFFFDREKFAF